MKNEKRTISKEHITSCKERKPQNVFFFSLFFFIFFFLFSCPNPILKKALEPLVPEECKFCVYEYDPPRSCSTTSKEISVECKHRQHIGYTRTVVALPHSMGSWAETTAPTCTATGTGTRSCTNCGTTDSNTTIPALGHDVSSWVVASTTYPATSTGICTRCGPTSRDTQIGDTGPGGGKIFYVSADGFTVVGTDTGPSGIWPDSYTAHYLEAAPSGSIPGTFIWQSATRSIDTATGIGTGRKNTALIHAHDDDTPAASACVAYTGGSKTDWFLPSWNELTELYNQKTAVGFVSAWHWSSSQNNNVIVYTRHLNTGLATTSNKGNSYNVHAIRAF